MFYKFTIDLQRLLDGNVLPKTMENRVLFYEIVIKNGGNAILRIPFNDKDNEWKLELYDDDTEINTNRVQLSMMPHIARFDKSKELTFHAVKLIKDVDNEEGPLINRIGYETHIREGTSDIQDMPFFKLTEKSKIPTYFKDFQIFDNVTPLKKVTELPLHDYGGFKSQYWLTQREFYSTSHVTLSDHVHVENLQLIRDGFYQKYKKYSFSSLLEFLQRLAKVVTKGRIKYRCDKKFAQTSVPTDAGNISIETSMNADCEDFSHFYMRIFRTVVSTYRFFIENKNSDIYSKCKQLEENYVAFNFICRVKQEHRYEFHCTMLLIPNTIKLPVISFEVTNTKKSYILPSVEYHDWHDENYFLVDNYFISKVNKISLEKISLNDLKFINY